MTEAFQKLFDYGLLGILLAMMLLATAWVGRRLFGKGGILEKLVERSIAFVDQLAGLQDKLVQSQGDMSAKQAAIEANLVAHAERSAKACEQVADIDVSQDALKAAGRHACDVAEAVCTKLEILAQTRDKIASIREVLR